MKIKNIVIMIIFSLVPCLTWGSTGPEGMPEGNAPVQGTETPSDVVKPEGSDKTDPECSSYKVLMDEFQNNLAKKDLVVTVQHRGDFSDINPENSLGAFKESYRRCRAGVETDVRPTADGELVIFHDLKVGKMLEPTYNPEANSGPNDLLSDLTLQQLEEKNLVNVSTRQPTDFKVPTLDAMLDDYLANKGQSILFLETKTAGVIMPTAWKIYQLSLQHPDEDVMNRIVIKANMAEYPSPDLWKSALIEKGIPEGLMVMIDPMITPNDAKRINAMPDEVFKCPDGVSDPKSICAVRAWAESPSTVSPMVSVIIKDSSDFINTTTVQSPQGEFSSPTSLEVSNTKPGTVANMVAIIKGAGKSLESFSPVPDYMFWKNLNFYSATVYDGNIPQDISVKEAFYNNDSSCCYRLLDKLSSSDIAEEKQDIRMNLQWLRNIGVNVITADDTDSMNTYYQQRQVLDTVLTSYFLSPKFEMQSILAWQLGYAANDVSLVGNAGSPYPENVYALYTNPNSYAWTYPPNKSLGADYSNFLNLVRLSDGRVSIKAHYGPTQCLWSDQDAGTWTWIYWRGQDHCDLEGSKWQMVPTGQDTYYFTDSKNMMLTWQFSGKLYYGIDYGTVYSWPKPDNPSAMYEWKMTGFYP